MGKNNPRHLMDFKSLLKPPWPILYQFKDLLYIKEKSCHLKKYHFRLFPVNWFAHLDFLIFWRFLMLIWNIERKTNETD